MTVSHALPDANNMNATSTDKIMRPAVVSRTIFILSVIIVGAATGVLGYYAGGGFRGSPSTVILNGAGATFPFPLLSAMQANYSRQFPNVQINYNAIGSGGGVNALIAKTVDFAASDVPLTDTERSSAVNSLHIPETIGAVVIAYNAKSGIPTGLHLNSTAISAIFQGNITTWNDPMLTQLNPGLTLPGNGISMVHRSDGSGTTAVFTKYLVTTATSGQDAWKLGSAKSIGNWPASSLGASGNQGVAGVIQGTKYTIGYVELNYALTNNMPVAYVLNHDGNTYVQPSLQNSTYAVTNSTNTLPAGSDSWTSVTLSNAPGAFSYPIVTFTYLLVYKELNVVPDLNQNSATALVNYLWWVVHDGQSLSKGLYYVPLPQSVVTVDEATLRSITYNGVVLHP